MAAGVKKEALIYLALALILTVLIGAGLPHLQFQPGLPIPSVAGGQVVVEPAGDELPVGVSVSLFFKIVFLVAITVFVSYLVYRLIQGVSWREVLSGSRSLLLILLIVVGIIAFAVLLLPRAQTKVLPGLLSPSRLIATSTLGPVPSLLIWLVGVALLCAAVLLALWWISRPSPASAPISWEMEAENARQAILTGGDLKDVILQCYQRMSRALLQEQKIERATSMTAGEFERLLAEQGVPREPVHQLTRLFEAVRYGHLRADANDEEVALRSLDAILKYSRSADQEG